jgi:hypothetical protein
VRQIAKRNEIERDWKRGDRETHREEEEGVIKKYWVRCGEGVGERAGSQLLVGEESAWGM